MAFLHRTKNIALLTFLSFLSIGYYPFHPSIKKMDKKTAKGYGKGNWTLLKSIGKWYTMILFSILPHHHERNLTFFYYRWTSNGAKGAKAQ